MANDLAEYSRTKRQLAHARAFEQNWQPRGRTGHTIWELMSIEDDFVYVYKTLNLDTGISVAIDDIIRTAPYELYGAGQKIGIWDGGAIRATHQEFDSRVNVIEPGEEVNHSTHVAGTICAAGIKPNAIGMAPQATVDGYDFDDDLSEMTLVAMSYAGEPNTIQISNHSYGTVCGWDYTSTPTKWYGRWGDRESDVFGQYDSDASDKDELCYDAPYYLPFLPAGNDRNEDAPTEGETFEYYRARRGWISKQYNSQTDPYDDGWDNGGFDTILPTSTAKNVMTVGAVNHAVTNQQRDLGSVISAYFSGWGPTDDGRIKPDIVTDGMTVYSPSAASDISYTTFTGTSMATACASGATLILTEYWKRVFPDTAIRSSTIKGLIIHTADDLGTPGPDYKFGWGLMNVKAAVDHIDLHYENGHAIVEEALDDTTTTHKYAFYWDGINPIRATLVWTDPAAPSVTGLDNPSPRLVNDLDLRIIDPCENVHYSFILDPSQPDKQAQTGDNTLDNVEQIVITSPTTEGIYYIQVEYKGALVYHEQYYSLFLSGQSPEQVVSPDLDHNGVVDLLDLAILTSYWLTDEPSVDIAPTGDGSMIDFADFAKLAEEWMQPD